MHRAFFWIALQVYFGISSEKAKKIVNDIEIFHPYGQVGRLEWQEFCSSSVLFGGEGADISSLFQNIRTFTEQTSDKSYIEKIRSAITDVEIIVFLGFAFHKMNMTLIKGDSKPNVRRIIATALGMSNDAAAIVENELGAFKLSPEYAAQLRTDLTCAQLIDEYYRSLSSR